MGDGTLGGGGELHVLVLCENGHEVQNRGRFEEGIVEIARDKGWVLRRGGVSEVCSADGVIVHGVAKGRLPKLKGQLGNVPSVWAQRERPKHAPAVALSEGEIGRVGARHLAEAGFRELVFLSGNRKSEQGRWDGFCRGASESGVVLVEQLDAAEIVGLAPRFPS